MHEMLVPLCAKLPHSFAFINYTCKAFLNQKINAEKTWKVNQTIQSQERERQVKKEKEDFAFLHMMNILAVTLRSIFTIPKLDYFGLSRLDTKVKLYQSSMKSISEIITILSSFSAY